MQCLSWNCNNEATNKVLVGIRNNKSVFEYYCDDCVKSFAVCEKCGVHINIIGLSMNQFYVDGHYVCWDCIKSTKFHKCHRCSNSVFDDAEYCLGCAKDKYINQYSYKPNPTFFGEDKVVKNLFAGIELEMNFDDISDFKKFLNKYNDNKFVYLKRDGSIGSNGVEIVSHPASFHYHIHNEWKDIFDMFKHTNTLGCGLHIHLSKNAFNNKEVEFLDYFINKCTYTITQIGSRGLENYCKKINARRYGYNRRSCHTDACNLTNDHTIELRFCNSTHNYNSFMKKLKNIYALILFVKVLCKKNMCDIFMKEENKEALEKHFAHFKAELLSRI